MAKSASTRRLPPPRRPAPPPRRPPAKRGFPVWPVAIGLVVMLGVVVIAIATLGGDDDADTGSGGGDETLIEETAEPVEVSGEALPQFAQTEDDAAIGFTFPTLSGTDLDGQPITIGGSGRPTLVVFVAHWCPHCQREVPVIQEWVDAGNLPDDVDLVTVSTSIDPSRPNFPPSAWLADEGWTAPTLVDPDNAAGVAAGLSAYPYFVVVDADGNVVARVTGELPTGELDQLVELARG
jgi:cytochrome c biogenesis protein CcmG, thiol:disulfide interchange protein DsbE